MEIWELNIVSNPCVCETDLEKMTIGEIATNMSNILQELSDKLSSDIRKLVELLRKLRKPLLELEDTQEYIKHLDNLIKYFEEVNPKEVIESYGYMRIFIYKLIATIRLFNKITKEIYGFDLAVAIDFIEEMRQVINEMEA